MNIRLSGHHLDITQGIRDAVDSRFDKLQAHFPQVVDLDLFLTVEKHEQKAEAKTHFLGATVAVQATNKDLYVAIADAAKKLESALRHRKGSISSVRPDKGSLAADSV